MIDRANALIERQEDLREQNRATRTDLATEAEQELLDGLRQLCGLPPAADDPQGDAGPLLPSLVTPAHRTLFRLLYLSRAASRRGLSLPRRWTASLELWSSAPEMDRPFFQVHAPVHQEVAPARTVPCDCRAGIRKRSAGLGKKPIARRA